MKEYNELENLMYSIGTQLWSKDRLLYDLFDKRFNHIYTGFSYGSSETDKIEQLKRIENLQKEFSMADLIKGAMLQSDYYRLHQLKWLIGNYVERIKDYKLNCQPIVLMSDLEETFSKRIKELKDLKLDDWRKSNDKVLHHHYYWWIEHLMNEESYSMWALQYNDTRIFDTFHLSNYGDKTLPKIFLQYILDSNIIPNQMDKESKIEIISPFTTYGMYNGYEISASSNIGGMWYMIYLTASELQEIYKNIGSTKVRKMNVMPFFSYVNALRISDHELNTKFYLYFKK